MSKFLVEFFAPRGEISPDPERAELVIEATDEAEARRAGEAIVQAECESAETFVTWVSDSLAQGEPFMLGIHVCGVTRLADDHPDEPHYTARQLLAAQDSQ